MENTIESPTITFAIASIDRHFEEIIQLQRSNHHQALSPDQQVENGFLFAEHTVDILKKMAVRMPQIIALNKERVIGYNLAMDQSMAGDLPMLTPMFQEFEKCNYKGKPLSQYPFMVGGQVCVDKQFRGMGLLRSLYEEARKSVNDRFQMCVTEISVRNEISLKAHQKMGFKIAGSYDDGREMWHIVVWEFNEKQDPDDETL
ncbi:MAG: hypothetical protein EOP48_01515 [Sphingobacteriales bacterium]|nr:MAG: hypothetical protein EOP48_01515 [Sphingobacteriales bacterium]